MVISKENDFIDFPLFNFQKTKYCQKFVWSNENATTFPSNYNSSTSSSSPSVKLKSKLNPILPIVVPQPAITPVETPCKRGIEYLCFSRATAKNCKFVSQYYIKI